MPLQKISWEAGTPCLYDHKKQVMDSPTEAVAYKRSLYKLEFTYIDDYCPEFRTRSGADRRYTVSSMLASPPNELQIQDKSGVWDKLIRMPWYTFFAKDAANDKSKIEYALRSRQTIDYKPSCGTPITEVE